MAAEMSAAATPITVELIGFNGAAADWLRRSDSMTGTQQTSGSFNGAAADWLRR